MKYFSPSRLGNLNRDMKVSLADINQSFRKTSTISISNFSYRNLITNCDRKCIFNESKLLKHNGLKPLRKYSEETKAASIPSANKESLEYYRTRESDPRKHDERHLGRIYTMPGMLIVAILRL